MQLLIGMSMSRYLPAIGHGRLAAELGERVEPVPRPPPRIRLRTSFMRASQPLKPEGRVRCDRPASPERREQTQRVYTGFARTQRASCLLIRFVTISACSTQSLRATPR